MDIMDQIRETLLVLNNESIKLDDLLEISIQIKKVLGEKISAQLIKQGKVIILDKGQVLFNEGDGIPMPEECQGCEVFILLNGMMMGRSRISESVNQATIFEKGEIIGEEILLEKLGLKNGHKPHYKETVMAGFQTAKLIGLTANQCLELFRHNPDLLLKQLRKWMRRSIISEERLFETLEIMQVMGLSEQKMDKAKEVIQGLIETKQVEALSHLLLSQLSQQKEIQKMLEQYESECQNKEKLVFSLKERLMAMEEGFRELMSAVPSSSTQTGIFDADVTDSDIGELLEKIRQNP